jgi:TRAP transporter 4TM/12TM fusion protein
VYGVKVGATSFDQTMFLVMLGVLFEAVRRSAGLAVLVVVVVAFVYAKFAYVLPGLWGAPEFEWERLTEYMYLYESGIFGMVLGVATTTVITFVTFGNFLIGAGSGTVIMDMAMAVAGKWRGGPAKVAVLSSGFMGMISGSPSSIVGTTGVLSIPLMKKIGYRPYFAGAVEAVAATGGQIMPPVMGSVAFIMGEVTGRGYAAVCVAAVLPALLYYICLYIQIDLEAKKAHMVGMPADQLPSLKKTIKDGWYLLFPIVLLIILIVAQADILESVLLCIPTAVVLSWLRKETRMGLRKIIDALARSTRAILMIVPAMAAIGIIFGTVTLTGLTVNLAGLITEAAGGRLWLLAILAWLVVYASGMAIGEMIIYIVMSIIVVPAFMAMGVPMMAAHMFIFYIGISMMITPPNCPPVYVACSIAGSDMWKTGFQAMKLGAVVFLIPFLIIFHPALIMEGSGLDIALAFANAVVAVYFMACAVSGHALVKAPWWQRVLFMAGGIILFLPFGYTTIIGLILGGGTIVVQRRTEKRELAEIAGTP